MKRQTITLKITATNSATTCPAIDMRNIAFGLVRVPASVTAIGWYASQYPTYSAAYDHTSQTGPREQVYDSSNSAKSTTTTAEKWIPIPDECMGAAFLFPILTGATSADVLLQLKD